jgi:hypothetical protein
MREQTQEPPTALEADPMSASRPDRPLAVQVARWRITSSLGRVWLTGDPGADPDLAPAEALAVAAALQAAAQHAERQQRRLRADR